MSLSEDKIKENLDKLIEVSKALDIYIRERDRLYFNLIRNISNQILLSVEVNKGVLDAAIISKILEDSINESRNLLSSLHIG